jgi:hypothetical protein
LLKREEMNQIQLAGRRAKAAKSMRYPKKMDSGDFWRP